MPAEVGGWEAGEISDSGSEGEARCGSIAACLRQAGPTPLRGVGRLRPLLFSERNKCGAPKTKAPHRLAIQLLKGIACISGSIDKIA